MVKNGQMWSNRVNLPVMKKIRPNHHTLFFKYYVGAEVRAKRGGEARWQLRREMKGEARAEMRGELRAEV
jgi:hypothetical protein